MAKIDMQKVAGKVWTDFAGTLHEWNFPEIANLKPLTLEDRLDEAEIFVEVDVIIKNSIAETSRIRDYGKLEDVMGIDNPRDLKMRDRSCKLLTGNSKHSEWEFYFGFKKIVRKPTPHDYYEDQYGDLCNEW